MAQVTDPLFARYGRQYEPGDVLCREGERGDEMFVIQSGSVRIVKDVGGKECVLALLGAGEFLGELAILNGKPRTATAIVVEPTRCLLIDSRRLEQMVANNAEIAMRLIKKLAKRLASADTLIEILMHHDPKARIMLALSRYAEAFGEAVAGGVRIRTTPRLLADEVGVDPLVAEEVMAKLSRIRLATEQDESILISDIGRLQDFLELLEMPKKFGGES